jgi:predicted phosphodiesterase
MRIAVIADIHGNADALAAVLAELDRLAPDALVNLGDVLAGPLDAAGTRDLLAARDILTVRGNHDRTMAARDPAQMYMSDKIASAQLSEADVDALGALPETAVVNGEVFLCHGTPRSDMGYWLEDIAGGRTVLRDHDLIAADALGFDYPVLLCGHTHLPRAIHLKDGRLIVNPGSVGCPGYDWDIPADHKVETGTPNASFALLERRAGRWFISHHSVPYDTTRMVALARGFGQEQWARVLATGRIT